MSSIITSQGVIEIRELCGLPELAAAERIQLDVWGQDTLPEGRELFQAIQHSGGLVAGAFAPSSELIGFIFAFPTRDPAVQHSHRLAVRAEWRGARLGAALKWFQRDWCLARGITRVHWTVDPLRMPNAELNVRILGATTRTYWPDYYGAMQGLDAGLPSDRFWMDWRLDSAHVAALAQTLPPDSGFADAQPANRVLDNQPSDARPDLDAPSVLIRIPPNFVALSANDRALAVAWRQHTRLLFQAYFARGYYVSAFTRLNGPAYRLDRDSDEGPQK